MRKDRISHLGRARDGLGAIEFGFIAPFLLTLLLGVADFGMAYWQQMQVANAADAGAQWGMSNAYDATSITSVAQGATNLSTSVTVEPSNPYGCPSDTGITYYSQNSTCPDNSTPKQYIVVTTRMCYSTLFSWPGLAYCSSGSTACTGCSASQVALSAQSVVLK
jgi:Flp pilus assembly protein TadG